MGDRSLAARAGCVFGHRSRPCSALRNIAKALASDSVAHVNAAVQTAHPGDCIRCQKRTPLSPLTSFSNSNPPTPSATLGTRFARLGSLQIASPACAYPPAVGRPRSGCPSRGAVTRLCVKIYCSFMSNHRIFCLLKHFFEKSSFSPLRGCGHFDILSTRSPRKGLTIDL